MTRRFSVIPIIALAAMTAALGLTILHVTPFPQDDHYLYQQFIETLAGGKLDLTIPGFHGSDFIGVVWHLVFPSYISQIWYLSVWVVLLPVLAYLAGSALYRSAAAGILLAAVITMMPFVSFVYLRGWTGPAYFGLMLLTIAGAARQSRWTGFVWALAMLTKPFAIILFPLILVLAPKTKSPLRTYETFLIGGGLVLLYMVIQFIQAGHLLVGAHHGVNETNLWQSWTRMMLNLAHAVQILFSVHNYYYISPQSTGPGNLMHTSPVLIFLGLFAVLQPKEYFEKSRIGIALLIGAIMGLVMNAMLDHMDHFWMEASILLFILAALPALLRHPLWIPIALATLHFQWFYFALQYGMHVHPSWWFAVPALTVDVLGILWCLLHWKTCWRYVSAPFSLR